MQMQNTPLHIIAAMDIPENLDMVKAWIEWGANPNIKDVVSILLWLHSMVELLYTLQQEPRTQNSFVTLSKKRVLISMRRLKVERLHWLNQSVMEKLKLHLNYLNSEPTQISKHLYAFAVIFIEWRNCIQSSRKMSE